MTTKRVPPEKSDAPSASVDWLPPQPDRNSTGWRMRLVVTDKGKSKALLANAIIALRHAPEWEGVLGFNEFSLDTVVLKNTPWAAAAGLRWTDQEDRLTADWLQHNGIEVGLEISTSCGSSPKEK